MFWTAEVIAIEEADPDFCGGGERGRRGKGKEGRREGGKEKPVFLLKNLCGFQFFYS